MEYTIAGTLIGIFVIFWLLIQLVKTQNKLNFMTLRYSEIKKSNEVEGQKTNSKEQEDYSSLISMLLLYAKNKPVLLLKSNDTTKVKRSFEIKKTGVATCRIKSNKAGGKRITMSGVLALENKVDNTFISLDTMEYINNPELTVLGILNLLKEYTIKDVVDVSGDD